VKASELPNTAGLVRAAQMGDIASRDAVFARFYPVVLRIAELRLRRRILGDENAEDIAQESLLEAFVSLKGFEQRSEGDFRNWLARIVENNIKDHRRKQQAGKRGRGRVFLHADLSQTSISDSIFLRSETTPSRVARGAELERKLEVALTTGLSEPYREVIILRRLCGMSYQEIAKDMGYDKEATVRSMFSRAMDKLKSLL